MGLFDLGQVVATPGAIHALAEAEESGVRYLYQHHNGDWEDMSPVDAVDNRNAVKDGSRIFSAYHLHTGVKIWIITEADRSVTTILLPDEY